MGFLFETRQLAVFTKTNLLTILKAVDLSALSPAATEVDLFSSNATADLFPAEAIQLTDEVLANLTSYLGLSDVSLFSFQNDSDEAVAAAALRKRARGQCKTYPGDLLWPAQIIWDIFDILLGGALTKTVPFASVCYDGFGNKDPAKCAVITSNWVNNSYLQ